MPKARLTKSVIDRLPFAEKGQVAYCDEDLPGFYGVVAKSHSSETPPLKFGYTDNGHHRLDMQQKLAIISVATFVRDFSDAVGGFLQDAKDNPELKARIDSRIDSLLLINILN